MMGSATGSLIWSSKYIRNSLSNKLSVDAAGNVFVAAEIIDTSNSFLSPALIKYNAAGEQQWSRNNKAPTGYMYNAGLVSNDAAGDLYALTGHIRSSVEVAQAYVIDKNSFSLMKYGSSGNPEWLTSPGYDSFTNMYGFIKDAKDNTYITGSINRNSKGSDIITAKFDSSGFNRWSAFYNSPEDSTDIPHDIYVDRSRNVYVAGESEEGAATGKDYIVIKYDSAGTEKWTARYNGPDFKDDVAQKVIADDNGNVFVTGNSENAHGNYDIVTVKYDRNGQFQWAENYNGPSDGNDIAGSLALDPEGNIIVAATSDSLGTLFDYLVIKYDVSGNILWKKRYNGPANDGDHANAMITDDKGNVYVTGWSVGNGTEIDFATVKYSSEGIRQWVARWDDPAGSEDGANAIAIDNQKNVYITGYSTGEETRKYITTVKYNIDGIQQWASQYNADSVSSDSGMFNVLDENNSIYVLGQSDNNLKLIKYDADGVVQSEIKNEPVELSKYFPSGITVSNEGNIYIAGTIKSSNWSLWDIRKFRQPDYVPTGTENIIAIPSIPSIIKSYPNPFSNYTFITYTLAAPGFINLTLYNTLSMPVKTFVNEFKSSGEYGLEFYPEGTLPDGLYFLQLRIGGKLLETGKIILVK
jgi:hypothetical protein